MLYYDLSVNSIVHIYFCSFLSVPYIVIDFKYIRALKAERNREMLYSVSSSHYSVEYASSGMLDSPDQFMHPRRCIDTYVLIIVQTGTLYITMADREFSVSSHQFIVLFPNIIHFGTKPSQERLTYYWMHFSIQDPYVQLVESNIFQKNHAIKHIVQNYLKAKNTDFALNDDFSNDNNDFYILPSAGNLHILTKTSLIFQFLLDMTKKDHYQITWRCHYLASYLVLETSYEVTTMREAQNARMNTKVIAMLEYIRTHYPEAISTSAIAQQFDFHPVYAERLFKANTGYSITQYINKVRIETAQNLLLNSIRKVETIASVCGFSDVRYFMHVFKKYVGMTPSQYRKNVSEKKINIH